LAVEEVESEVTGSVWKIVVEAGASVAEGDVLLIIESMKMEIPVEAPCGGTVETIHVEEGQSVEEEDLLVTLEIA